MRRRILVAAILGAAACTRDPVEWSDVSYSAPGAVVNFPVRAFPDSSLCGQTVRIQGAGGDSVAVWWSVRRDSSAKLMFSRSSRGIWSTPIPADTTDASSRGCVRPAPAIAYDKSHGYVNIVYFLEPASGSGVFFTHSMDQTGFHDPVSISFGKRPSVVSIASQADRVAVAYEEPNAERGQIWLALSKTMGHIFEARMPVSSANEIARDPRVRLSGTKLEIEWEELVQSDSLAKSRHASRTGIWN